MVRAGVPTALPRKIGAKVFTTKSTIRTLFGKNRSPRRHSPFPIEPARNRRLIYAQGICSLLLSAKVGDQP